MNEPVGRFLVRADAISPRIASIFVPIGESMPRGIYEVREIDGEYLVNFVGEPACGSQQAADYPLDDLHVFRDSTLLTKEELDKTNVNFDELENE